MRIVAVSDTHGMWDQITVPEGDVLVHAGDITGRGGVSELAAFNEWLGRQPHTHKVVIAGNHDWAFERSPTLARSVLTHGTYLQDEAVVLDGVRFYGSPWQPRFFDWAFNLDRGEPLRQVWSRIPKDTEVLVTHGPAFESLDVTNEGMRVGCEELQTAIRGLNSLKAHIFGHIHHSYGIVGKRGIVYANASVCDEGYRPLNPPHVFDL